MESIYFVIPYQLYHDFLNHYAVLSYVLKEGICLKQKQRQVMDTPISNQYLLTCVAASVVHPFCTDLNQNQHNL